MIPDMTKLDGFLAGVASERAAVVAWLRNEVKISVSDRACLTLGWAADSIEAGEHLAIVEAAKLKEPPPADAPGGGE